MPIGIVISEKEYEEFKNYKNDRKNFEEKIKQENDVKIREYIQRIEFMYREFRK